MPEMAELMGQDARDLVGVVGLRQQPAEQIDLSRAVVLDLAVANSALPRMRQRIGTNTVVEIVLTICAILVTK